MEFCISPTELARALKANRAAKRNGFDHCLCVFKMSSAGPMLDECRAEYSDLSERAHPTDSSKNWGRFQNVSGRNRFDKKTGKLVRLQ